MELININIKLRNAVLSVKLHINIIEAVKDIIILLIKPPFFSAFI